MTTSSADSTETNCTISAYPQLVLVGGGLTEHKIPKELNLLMDKKQKMHSTTN